jgi:hypothetical protein
MRALAPALQKQAACFTHSVRPVRVQRIQRARMSVQAAKQVISTEEAPAALGPYSQVCVVQHTWLPLLWHFKGIVLLGMDGTVVSWGSASRWIRHRVTPTSSILSVTGGRLLMPAQTCLCGT